MRNYSLALAALGIAARTCSLKADVVTDWNTVALDAIRTTSTNPPRASRALAMMHCAVFDAVNALQGNRYVSYATTSNPPHFASTNAAASAAAHRVLNHLYPTLAATFDAALAQSLQGIPSLLKTNGVNWGNTCADDIISLRSDDNSNLVVPYNPPAGPGYWIPTPPGNLPALLPNWPIVTPWTMQSGNQFRPVAPPDLTSNAYTVAFNEVKDLGEINSTIRTPEQTEIALFWADGAGTATPPGHWNVIAVDVATVHNNSVLENARMFAMLNCATADAAIASWDAKYAYNHWRPVTGIRAADTDSNPATIADGDWTPLITTPPFPSYTSGHSTFSGAASTALAAFFGIDDVSFTATSEGLPNVTRTFDSFSEASSEAGQSRIYGGIHWQYDNQEGLAAGQALAQQMADNFFGLLGDLDHDGDVDVLDLVLLLQAWGACPTSGACPEDLNHDGIVNGHDLLMLLLRFTH